MYSGKSGCIRAKSLYSGKSNCNWERSLHSGNEPVFG